MLFVLIAITFLITLLLFILLNKEGFDHNLGHILPVHISDDLNEITVPNTLTTNNGEALQFMGNVKAPILNVSTLNVTDLATFNHLLIENETILNTVTLGPTKLVGNNLVEFNGTNPSSGSIGYKTELDTNALNIIGANNGTTKKVHLWDDVVIDGNLNLTGNMTILGSGQKWSLTARSNGWIDFLHNDTSQDDYTPGTGHLILSSDGNFWLANSNYQGWIADNEQTVLTNREQITARIKAEAERLAAEAQAAAEAAAAEAAAAAQAVQAAAAQAAQDAANAAAQAASDVGSWFSGW